MYRPDAFFGAAIRMHDELICVSGPALADRPNAAFQSRDLWESYFAEQALSCLLPVRTKIVLLTRPNPLLRTIAERTGAKVLDEPLNVSGIRRSILKRLRAEIWTPVARSKRVGVADALIVDSQVNDNPDPIAMLRDLAERLQPGGVMICTVRFSPSGREDYFRDLGFVLPSLEDLLSLGSDGFEIEIAPKSERASDTDSWPAHKLVGMLLRRRQ